MAQSEQVLENDLVNQLVGLGFKKADITDEKSLLANLKVQIEKLNGLTKSPLSEIEFKKVLNALSKGSVFDKAKTLRDRLQINRDDSTPLYIQFFSKVLSKNQLQVTQQVIIEGRFQNRYDVTILVNGLPLVQIELKRRGLELKEAFNQINRYQRHSYWASYSLFQYVQVFVISNGVNTKYYANNKDQSFKQTFYWANEENTPYTELSQFADIFLEPAQLLTIISKYIVLSETRKILMVMRPYQIYATEAIVNRVFERNEIAKSGQRVEKFNGYIWHTTGSGKTLTSFKTAQLLTQSNSLFKVIFVVDRKDLDFQTSKEFNSFAKGCVDSTDHTDILVKQFTGKEVYYKETDDGIKATSKAKGGQVNIHRNSKLIVTTIQKLNNAISNKRYLSRMDKIKDKPVVFIFDECHRSQFGDIHKRIVNFFSDHQLFGFTGTPILADNAKNKLLQNSTTKSLFDECLHKYTIVDAIKDENVLKFSVEYVGRYTEKESSNEKDIEVEGINTKELLESPERLGKIADYIIANHKVKTHNHYFNGMFCVGSVETLIKYYEIFQAKKEAGEHNLKIATIFSYAANENDQNANGEIADEEQIFDKADQNDSPYNSKVYTHSRDKLEQFIADYNAIFETSYTTKDSKSFYNYYNDISKRVRERKVDVLLVVNMFLTGFDSPSLNTLYVDKNLKQHGLIQAFSRTNRIINEKKSQGNIVCFRNLKKATDTAVTLFSNKDAIETVLMPEYCTFIKLFNEAVDKLQVIAPDVSSVDYLKDEEEELEFIKAFREMMRLKNILSSFSDFSFDDLALEEQEFEDYKSKYLDMYDMVKTGTEKVKVSILDEVDFELELIQRDEINVHYILQLLAKLKNTGTDEEYEAQYKSIMQLLGGSPELRSKKELIEKFIEQNLENIELHEEVTEVFDDYWEQQKLKAVNDICNEESLVTESVKTLLDKMIYSNEEPLRDEIVATMEKAPSLLQRNKVIPRLKAKLKEFVTTFSGGM